MGTLYRQQQKLKRYLPQLCIVVGPIANDGIAYLLGRYHEGTKSLEELAKDLQDRFLDMQYMFATAKAVNLLRKERSILL